MKAAIRCTGSQGKEIKKLIEKYNERFKLNIEVIYFIDIKGNQWGDIVEEIEVISPVKANELYQIGEIEKFFIPSKLGIRKIDEIICEMNKLGIENEDIYLPPVSLIEESILEEKLLFTTYNQLSQMYYLEFHIADHCNMNCNACSHFSPMSNEKFSEFINVKKDFIRLKEIVEHIENIRILGGEPFLNKELDKYIKMVREIYPLSNIYVVTNGILLNKLNEKLINCIKENDAIIAISLYKPMWPNIDKIVKYLKDNKINYEIMGQPIFEFTSCFNLNSKENYMEKRNRCSAPCTNLQDGKLTPCPIAMYTPIFNTYFGTELPVNRSVNIYDNYDNASDLRKVLKQPMKICQYCDTSQMKGWGRVENAKCKIENWIVEK